ncbi:MAG: phosphonate C-P lyase system protein PhnH, partial [Coriobacteriia bacterium]|nr:phosphonate C-P lyase system protein PhnH [Coriobacteriia bacterium]
RVLDGQGTFRLLLEAIAHPAQAVNIAKFAAKIHHDSGASTFSENTTREQLRSNGCAINSVFLAVAMTLLDNETGFAAIGDQSLVDEIELLTLATKTTLDNADFIFVCNESNIKDAIEHAKYGTLADPHKGATLIINNDGIGSQVLTLQGPGVDKKIEIQATQAMCEALYLRDEQCYEYPEGIDLFFVDSAGNVRALPRLIQRKDT